ncbi:MAG: hypothetical protein SPE55_00780 [Sodaliphilus sp.]|nr:hypothetical protein [Sodaliphilus sp.]
MDFGSVEKYWGLKQKHKKQPFSDASASHLSLVLWHRQKDKNRSPSAKNQTGT